MPRRAAGAAAVPLPGTHAGPYHAHTVSEAGPGGLGQTGAVPHISGWQLPHVGSLLS